MTCCRHFVGCCPWLAQKILELVIILKWEDFNMSLYVAYGSNLNIEQMYSRCPGAALIGSGFLQNVKLMFGSHNNSWSYATVKPELGAVTPVGIWEVNEEDEKRLDRYEGYPKLYSKKECCFEMQGTRMKGIIYVMNEPVEAILPTKRYMETCIQGYKDFGLNMTYLREAYNECVDEYEKRLMTRTKIKNYITK